MPNFPKFDLTKFDAAKLPSPEQIGDCTRNAVYMGVGLVVTTAERVVDTVKATATKVREARPAWPARPAA
jgi:hypothetical protein